jgi:hypothetical protein
LFAEKILRTKLHTQHKSVFLWVCVRRDGIILSQRARARQKRWGGRPELGRSGDDDDLGVQETRTAGLDLDPLRSGFISLHFFSLFPKSIWHLGLDTQLEWASYGE